MVTQRYHDQAYGSGKKFKPWKYSSLEAGLGSGWWAGRDHFLFCPWYLAKKHLSLSLFFFFKRSSSLVVQRLRICLQMPGDPDSVPSPGKMTHFQEATKPAHRNYWSPRTESGAPQREKPPPCEARAPHLESSPRFAPSTESRCAATKTQRSQR